MEIAAKSSLPHTLSLHPVKAEVSSGQRSVKLTAHIDEALRAASTAELIALTDDLLNASGDVVDSMS